MYFFNFRVHISLPVLLALIMNEKFDLREGGATGLMLDSGPERRQEDSRTSKDVSRPGNEPGLQELASCAITEETGGGGIDIVFFCFLGGRGGDEAFN